MTTNQSSPFDDPVHWRERAVDMRRIADEMEPLPLAKASLLRIADGYERLAARLAKPLTTK